MKSISYITDYKDFSFVSRGEAKSILEGLEDSNEIEIDLDGVAAIGQAFADEVFRVFPLKNSVKMNFKNAENNVLKMILHVKSRNDLPQAD